MQVLLYPSKFWGGCTQQITVRGRQTEGSSTRGMEKHVSGGRMDKGQGPWDSQAWHLQGTVAPVLSWGTGWQEDGG